MKLRFTRPAARQLDNVLTYIAKHSPQGAHHVHDRLQAVMLMLREQPQAGHLTARRGIRRFIASPYPYALTYRATDDEIIILGVRHTSRRPIA